MSQKILWCTGEKSPFGQRVDRLTVTWQSEVFNWDASGDCTLSKRVRVVHSKNKNKNNFRLLCMHSWHLFSCGAFMSCRNLWGLTLRWCAAPSWWKSCHSHSFLLESTTCPFKSVTLKGKRAAQPFHSCEHHNHCCYHPNKCTKTLYTRIGK